MRQYPSDIAFTPTVKRIQTTKGSRGSYSRVERNRGWKTTVTPDLVEFLSDLDMFYLGTASAEGQPYVQYRGGSPGFLKVLDEKTLAFADFGGNRQYITLGNLAENERAFLFFMDYERRRRIKVWGRARVVEGDAELLARLTPEGWDARVDRAIVFHVEAWDVNCPKHIPQKLDAAAVKVALDEKERRIRALETENRRLRSELQHTV